MLRKELLGIGCTLKCWRDEKGRVQGFSMLSCTQEEKEVKAGNMEQVGRMKVNDLSFPSVLFTQGRDGGEQGTLLKVEGWRL